MQNTRWGIIYCPRTGVRHSQKHWERIRTYLEQKGVEYDFVQSESADSVERLAEMLVGNGYRTLIVVGGDSALNRALNGMLAADGGREVALGVIPYGYGNDFARYWGFDETNYQRSVDWLIGHRTRLVDVGVLADAQGKSRYFLNCVNVGLASDIIAIDRTARQWGILRRVYKSLSLVFSRKQRRVQMRVNRDEIDREVMNVCVGSCRAYGLTPNAVPYSGLLDTSVVLKPGLKRLGQGIYLLLTGRFLNSPNQEAHRTRYPINIKATGGAKVSLDGLLWNEVEAPLSISLKPEYIRFIIPPTRLN